MKTECCGNPLRGCTDCPPAAPAAERPGKSLLWARKSDIESLPEDGGTVYLTPGPRPFTDWVALAGPLTMLTDEQIRALAVRSKTLPEFARAVIAEFCKINGIGSPR